MTFFQRVLGSGVPAAALLTCVLADVREAEACGGCFHPAVDLGGSVVTDHRMVFEITAKETILWDQVRYTGNPEEFAWVLPVHPGATIELSRGEWIAALDAATRTTVNGPTVNCPRPASASTGANGRTAASPSTSSSGGGGGGCGGGYSNSTETADGVGASAAAEDGSSGGQSNPTFIGNDGVEVVAQSSIGPYQAVTIRASGSTGISEWLKTNGFAIPGSVAPVIDSYTKDKFDFIALRLRPNQGVQAMRPVRIVSPGADTTLPLRMVAAGVGAKVGLTLWVIGEGRYHTQNFPDAPVDWSSLAWDVRQSRSNRLELEAAALASYGGRGWITEAAVRTSLTASNLRPGRLPNVFDAYTTQCSSRPSRVAPCDESALPPANGQPGDTSDGGAADDGGATDAGESDSGDGGTCTKVVRGCDGFDDLDVASRSIHQADVWVTRLRADLPMSALSADLVIEATPGQDELSPTHSTTVFNPPYDPCLASRSAASAPSSTPSYGAGGGDGCTCQTVPRKGDLGTWLLIGLTMVAVPLIARRRKR